MRLGISKEKASRLVITLAVALACVMVPASVMAIVGKQVLNGYAGSAGYSLTLQPASGWSTTEVTATVAVTDTANVAAAYRLWPADESTPSAITTGQPAVVSTSTAGRYKLQSGYVATGTTGPFLGSEVTEVGVDKTKPEVSIPSLEDTYTGIAELEIVATDPDFAGGLKGSGIKSVHYSLSEGAEQMGASVVTTVAAVHTLQYWAVDVAGNESAKMDATFTVLPDLLAPTTTAVAEGGLDLTKWQSADVTVTLEATDTPDGSGVKETYLSINGATANLYTGAELGFGEGINTLEFWSVDRKGNVEIKKSAVVLVDKTNPTSTSSLTELADGTQRLTIVATDTPSGVASIKASINGQTWYPVATAGDDQIASLPGVVDLSVAGTNTVEYVVEDYAGNREDTQTVEAIVSKTTQLPLTAGSRNLTNTKIPTRTTVKGTLRDGGVALAGEEVTIWSANNAAMVGEKQIGTKTTAADGTFSFWVSLSNKTYYRVKFAGTVNHLTAASRIVRLTPRVELSTPKASKGTKYAGRSFSVTGKLEPGHKTGTRVYLKRYLYSAKSKSYVYKGKTTVKVKRLSSASSAYSAALKLGKGKWEVRTYMPGDSLHTKTTSKALRVTVR